MADNDKPATPPPPPPPPREPADPGGLTMSINSTQIGINNRGTEESGNKSK